MFVPLNLTGGTYKSRSVPLSAQVCRNFWPRPTSPGAKSEYVLESFPGLLSFGTATGADRGMFEHLGVLYKVTGQTLYTVASDGTHTSVGTIPGSGRCIFSGFGSSIVICTDSVPYLYNGSVSTISDADLESPNSVAHLNNQILYDGSGGRFASSDVGDATSVDALNYATAETDADDLTRVYTFRQLAYMMGDKTIETWWNSGVGQPPFDRVEGGVIPIGLGALYSAANNDDYLYLLADDNQVYRIRGSVQENVTPPALAREFTNYSDISDAIGFCFNFQGQEFYSLQFPTARTSWIYPENGEWFELSSGVSGGRYIGNSYVYAHRKHLISDYRNGNIYELSETTYDENGSVIQRTRDTQPFHGGLFGKPGKVLEVNRFEIILETGVGLTAGQGIDPVIMLSLSNDGGRTFGTEMWGQVGALGEFQYKVEWFCLGSAETWMARIRTSDPVFYSIHSAGVDVEVGI